MKVDAGCHYIIIINHDADNNHSDYVEVTAVEKEKDGKRFIPKAVGHLYMRKSTIQGKTNLTVYLNPDPTWYCYISQLDATKDKKIDLGYDKSKIGRMLIKTLFSFDGLIKLK